MLAQIEEIKKSISAIEDSKEAARLKNYLNGISNELNIKKYGLIYEEHEETLDRLLKENLPVFTEEKDLYVDNGGEMNFLLEGDNLASLELLSKTHKGLVDVVYIDPPYNTGNTDFTYDDDYVEKEDAYKHSKWLSFMKRRLELAHEVMSNDGILFMSIDDKEQAALKILTDEIFGEDNFIVALPRQTKKVGKLQAHSQKIMIMF
ncbi:Adenine specific DNA methylase Mod-like protein [Bacillus cereus BDRD-ST26]|nr:Adenine specific DNA methylase Mod-like protein [Bacillus cereus BDRD-ST26]